MYKCTDCIQNIVPKFTRGNVNMCGTDGKFIYPVVMLQILQRYKYTAVSVSRNNIKNNV